MNEEIIETINLQVSHGYKDQANAYAAREIYRQANLLSSGSIHVTNIEANNLTWQLFADGAAISIDCVLNLIAYAINAAKDASNLGIEYSIDEAVDIAVDLYY